MSEILRTDVAVVGAGLVGLAAAVAMHQAGFSVVLIDSKNPWDANFADETWDARIYAISPKNAQWLQDLGIWSLMNQSRIGLMQAMEIFGNADSSTGEQRPITLSSSDVNADCLGYIVESKLLMQALLNQVETLGIQTRFNSQCEAVSNTPDKATLQLSDQLSIESTLLLAADGSHSWVRQQLNMPMQQKSYEQTAIVANFTATKRHGNIARQWFLQDSENHPSILAWLPLSDNTISIVWSVSTDYADTLLLLSENEFTNAVKLAGNSTLGDFKLLSPAVKFPLNLQKTNTLVKDSVVLIGDAAHQVHPMAGQGVNLGFRDVVDLVDVFKTKHQYQALNDSSLLKQYTRTRKVDILNMVLLTDSLYHLFNTQNSAIKTVRNWGLSATKHQAIKKLLVSNAVSL
ncbi:MAG: FAD-dependent monooxygenase [Methylotenera sp.]|uniref:FAD-dependent monooxygenase n=1 Tax=Methylotenera sp. TaxID=2051956 RepID=UPI00248A847E|nr:FAD-dependent monooxygenase [Methylotenera sp.]MDI1310317.1 FAD-dependent monooxygenase [Methylotenera sp.]